MTLLNTANALYVGATAVDKVYAGVNKVWEKPSTGVSWGPSESLYSTGAAEGAPSDPNTFMPGNRIVFGADGRVGAIRWYCHTPQASRYVALFTDSGTILAEADVTGEVTGWNVRAITPVLVTAGQAVRSAYGYAGAGNFAFTMNAPPGSANVLWGDGVYTTPQASGGERIFPSNRITPNNYYGDLVYQKKIASAPAGPTEWLTTMYIPGSNRDDFTGEVGVRLNIVTAFTATWIGVRYAGGPTTGYKVNLWEWFSDTVVRTVTIDLTGKAVGEYGWAPIEPITLPGGGGAYYALLLETVQSSGKLWANEGGIQLKPLIGNIYATYRSGGVMGVTSTNSSYVGVDLGWTP